MNNSFVRSRITELRLKRGVSEYQMSYDLGHSRGYINNISSGKSLPSMAEFLSICDYFNITPADFSDEWQENPELLAKTFKKFRSLNETDLKLVESLVNRLLVNNEKDK